jgi:uncharacterized damage-inducible protein DinB
MKLSTMIATIMLMSGFSYKNTNMETSLKQVLNDQLKTTHNKKDWFVPANIAIEGLTAEQAMWNDKSGNHSIGQLTQHLIFWNERQLATFKGNKPPDFNGNNDETFPNAFDKNSWPATVKKLDQVLTDLEKTIESADEGKLKEWAPTIANISTHNAYHTGQIIYVRKLQHSWDAEKGVK